MDLHRCVRRACTVSLYSNACAARGSARHALASANATAQPTGTAGTLATLSPIVQYMSQLAITVRARPDGSRIYPPVATVSYGAASNNWAKAATALPASFRISYLNDDSNVQVGQPACFQAAN